MLSDAFSNGGFLGVLIIAIIFSIIILIIDSTYRIPLYMVVSGLSYMAFVLNDTGLQTSLFTGGLGLLVILFMLFNSSQVSRNIVQKEWIVK